MIYVSRYGNSELLNGKYTCIAISVGKPKWKTGYNLDGEIKDLAPYGLLKITDNEIFIKKYKEKLDSCGVERIKSNMRLFQGDKPIVLLCHEDIRNGDSWCHRTVFAEWWKEKTGEDIPELLDPSIVKAKKNSAPIYKENLLF